VSGLRVLITNVTLASRSGTEVYVRDLAAGLLAAGHAPLVYSTDLGELAGEIGRATVPVVDDLAALSRPPDVIHGHHAPETLTALLHFPGVPAVAVCHDWDAWHDTPLLFPRVRRYVAVDETCRDRLLDRHGLPPGRVEVRLNAVDLDLFPPRAPLPPLPGRAAAFASPGLPGDHLPAVRAACARDGLPLDEIGGADGPTHARPGELLGRYDLVFAKARCALEALAVGAAVVLCGGQGLGGLVTAERFDGLRRRNFGRRTLREPLRAETVLREMGRYDPADAAAVSRRVRAEAGLTAAVADWVALYRAVIAEAQAEPADPAAEARAAAAALRDLTPFYRPLRELRRRAGHFEQAANALRAEHDSFAHTAEGLLAERDWLTGQNQALLADRDYLAGERESLRAERDWLAGQNQTLLAERDWLAGQNQALLAERDWLADQNRGLREECDWLRGGPPDRTRPAA
jgi:hypothetical protein